MSWRTPTGWERSVDAYSAVIAKTIQTAVMSAGKHDSPSEIDAAGSDGAILLLVVVHV